MFPTDFAYARPSSLDEALDLLDAAHEAGDEAKVIAGGQSLLPMMKLRLAVPTVLIDIADLRELRSGGWIGMTSRTRASGQLNLTIGASTTYRDLGRNPLLVGGVLGSRDSTVEPYRAPGVSSVTDCLKVLADPQVRARGTIGGAVAHGDPASDLPAVLLALDAVVVAASRKGRHAETSVGHMIPRRSADSSTIGKREVTLDDFLQGIYSTDLAEDEIVTSIRINSPGASTSAYEKFPHPASHLPLAGVAVVLTFNGGRSTDSDGNVTDHNDGSLARAAIAVTGISPRPYRARAAEAVLAGAFPTPETLAAAAALVTQDVSLLGDHHASADYRAHLAQVLTKRALAKAVARHNGIPEIS